MYLLTRKKNLSANKKKDESKLGRNNKKGSKKKVKKGSKKMSLIHNLNSKI